MGKTILNNYKMNDAIAMLKRATESGDRENFVLKCDNCTLSIVAGGMFESREVVEVGLFDQHGKAWLGLKMGDDGFVLDRPIIYNLPLICFPALARQFKSLAEEDFAEVWDAWDTIAIYS
jgi:hypothetical protein